MMWYYVSGLAFYFGVFAKFMHEVVLMQSYKLNLLQYLVFLLPFFFFRQSSQLLDFQIRHSTKAKIHWEVAPAAASAQIHSPQK